MTDEKKARKRPARKKSGGYVHRSNAVHLTLYDPSGKPLKPEVAEQAADAVTQFALENKLLIGLART